MGGLVRHGMIRPPAPVVGRARAGVVVLRRWLVVVGTVGALAGLASCTTGTPAPARTGTGVVAVAAPFTSLNGGGAPGGAPRRPPRRPPGPAGGGAPCRG